MQGAMVGLKLIRKTEFVSRKKSTFNPVELIITIIITIIVINIVGVVLFNNTNLALGFGDFIF